MVQADEKFGQYILDWTLEEHNKSSFVINNSGLEGVLLKTKTSSKY